MPKYSSDEPVKYIGNFWGWRFSALGGILLVGLLLLAWGVARSRGLSLWDSIRETPVPLIGFGGQRVGGQADSLALDTTAGNLRPTPQQAQ